ncbi:hypothetical protein HDU92_003569 [Lobulomyces angularis]|nr:hypothetical protein HDU92_003569 [Lobulomyces angularis]
MPFAALSTKNEVDKKLEELLKESIAGLNLNSKVKKDYKAPTVGIKFFRFPDTGLCIGSLVNEDSIPSGYLYTAFVGAGGNEFFISLLRGIFFMHFVECVAGMGFTIWAGFPVTATIKWGISIFLFGIFSLKHCVKDSVKLSGKLTEAMTMF